MNSDQLSLGRPISRAELTALTEYGDSHFRLIEPKEVSDHETVVRGDVRYVRFRSGLTMHCSDTLEVCDLTTQIVQEAGLSCFLFLEGTIDMRLGNRSFELGTPESHSLWNDDQLCGAGSPDAHVQARTAYPQGRHHFADRLV
jgi:hypothetical protein